MDAATWMGIAFIALGLFLLLRGGRGHQRGRYDLGDGSWVNNLIAELPGPVARVFYGFLGIVLIAGGAVVIIA